MKTAERYATNAPVDGLDVDTVVMLIAAVVLVAFLILDAIQNVFVYSNNTLLLVRVLYQTKVQLLHLILKTTTSLLTGQVKDIIKKCPHLTQQADGRHMEHHLHLVGV